MCNIALTKTFTVTKNEDDALVINQKDTKDSLNFKIKHKFMIYDIELDREAVEAIHKFLNEYLESPAKSLTEPLVEDVPTFRRVS